MKRLMACACAAVVVCGACQKPVHRLNAPPHGTTENPIELRDMYAQMADNALLADMCISDAHFLPHRAALNTLGEERLERLAGILEQYGGTLRFNTDLQDEALIQARTAAIVAFLRERGVDTSADVLTRDLPGGRGLDAEQAILIRANEGRYKAKKSDSGGGFKLLVPASQ
jgi:hypothetical protein